MRHASMDLEHNNRKYKPQFESGVLDPAEYNYKPVDLDSTFPLSVFTASGYALRYFMNPTAFSSNDLQDILDEVGRLKHLGGLI